MRPGIHIGLWVRRRPFVRVLALTRLFQRQDVLPLEQRLIEVWTTFATLTAFVEVALAAGGAVSHDVLRKVGKKSWHKHHIDFALVQHLNIRETEDN
eukprot:g70526.t1